MNYDPTKDDNLTKIAEFGYFAQYETYHLILVWQNDLDKKTYWFETQGCDCCDGPFSCLKEYSPTSVADLHKMEDTLEEFRSRLRSLVEDIPKHYLLGGF